MGILTDIADRWLAEARRQARDDDRPAPAEPSALVVVRRDPIDVIRIANLERMVATQQSEIVNLRARLAAAAPPASTSPSPAAGDDASTRFSLMELE